MLRSPLLRLLQKGIAYTFYGLGVLLYVLWLWKAIVPAVQCAGQPQSDEGNVTAVSECLALLDFEPITGALFAIGTFLIGVGYVTNKAASSVGEASLTSEKLSKERQTVISQLRRDYVDDWLQSKLGDLPYIELEKEATPELVKRNSDALFERRYQVASTTPLNEIYENTPGGWLLVYGEPGAGKTTALLRLLGSLLQKAEGNAEKPLPVYLNLGAWAGEHQSFRDWLADEISRLYSVSKAAVYFWIDNRDLILILDALDEVRDLYRQACFDAINTFRRENATSVVLSTRENEYHSLSDRLDASNAILLKPLNREAIEAILISKGGEGDPILAILEKSPMLMELASKPLFLSIIVLPGTVAVLEAELDDATESYLVAVLFRVYIRESLSQPNSGDTPYSPDVALRFLRNIASWTFSDKFVLARFLAADGKTLRQLSKFERDLPINSYHLSEALTNLLMPSLFWLLPNTLARILIWFELRVLAGFLAMLQVTVLLLLISTIYLAISIGSYFYAGKSAIDPPLVLLVSVSALLMLGIVGSIGMSSTLKLSAKSKTGLTATYQFAMSIGLDKKDGPVFLSTSVGMLVGALMLWTLPLLEGVATRIDVPGGRLLVTIYTVLILLTSCSWIWSVYIEPFLLRAWLHFSGKLPWNSAAFVEYCISRKLIHRVGPNYEFMHPMFLRALLEHRRRPTPNSGP